MNHLYTRNCLRYQQKFMAKSVILKRNLSLLQSLNDRVEKYTKEQETINEICAKFGAFLRENAILPYNDAIEDYLKFDIGEAKRQGDSTGSPETLQKVEQLKEHLRQYQV